MQDLPGAKKLLLFLVSDLAQRYFVEETHEFALASPAASGTPADLGRVDFAAVADSLEPALRLIHASGLARFQ